MELTQRFYNEHRSSNPTEAALVNFVKNKYANDNIVDKVIKIVGFPRWDKISVFKDANASLLGTTSTSTTYYIPLVIDSQNFVNATMAIHASTTDTTLTYLQDWQYQNLTNNNNSYSDAAENYAVFFMRQDMNVFGHKSFKILDSNLFRFNNHKVDSITLQPQVILNNINNLVLITTTCTPATIRFNCSDLGGAIQNLNSMPDPNLCSIAWDYCTTSTTVLYDPSGNGTPSGMTPITGGGGGGGGPVATGWGSISTLIWNYNVEIVLGLNEAELNWLNQNLSFAQEMLILIEEENFSNESKNASKITIAAAMANQINGFYNENHFNTYVLPNAPNLLNQTSDPGALYWIYFKVNCAILKQEHPEWSNTRIYWEATKETLHICLDVVGLVPVVGEIADLTNGLIYTIEGEGVNAALSLAGAIPIAGWGATGIKFANKTITLANGSKTILYLKKSINGIITFGDRGQLRKVLGLVVGDLRQAHHLIPWELFDNPLVQKAAGGDFHLNEILNGLPLSSIQHNGSHALYNQKIKAKLDLLWTQGGQYADAAFAQQLVRGLGNDIRTWILAHPNQSINNIILP